jgi:hypothetical protein
LKTGTETPLNARQWWEANKDKCVLRDGSTRGEDWSEYSPLKAMEGYARAVLAEAENDIEAIPDDRPIGANDRAYADGIALGSKIANKHWREKLKPIMAGMRDD